MNPNWHTFIMSTLWSKTGRQYNTRDIHLSTLGGSKLGSLELLQLEINLD